MVAVRKGPVTRHGPCEGIVSRLVKVPADTARERVVMRTIARDQEISNHEKVVEKKNAVQENNKVNEHYALSSTFTGAITSNPQ